MPVDFIINEVNRHRETDAVISSYGCVTSCCDYTAASGNVTVRSARWNSVVKVAVVTPYYQESTAKLRRCHDSVLAQTHPCTHYFVADGHPNAAVATWNVKHIVLADSHHDNGNTPRGIGGISAINSGFDAVAFLDADNWFLTNHIASLVTAIERTQAAVAASGRSIVLLDGTVLEAEDPEDRAGNHIDTSCYLVTTRAAFLIPLWAMLDQSLSPVGDRLMRTLLAYFKVPVTLTGQRTMRFESNYAVHYRMAGREPPAQVHAVDTQAILANFDSQRCYERTRTRLQINVDRQR